MTQGKRFIFKNISIMNKIINLNFLINIANEDKLSFKKKNHWEKIYLKESYMKVQFKIKNNHKKITKYSLSLNSHKEICSHVNTLVLSEKIKKIL